MSTHNVCFLWEIKYIYLVRLVPSDKHFTQKVLVFFLFLNKNIVCCGYSLKSICLGTQNICFSWGKKNWVRLISSVRSILHKHTHTHTNTEYWHFTQMHTVLLFFLSLYKNIYCQYSLEAPHWGASNEYPQYMLSLRNKEIFIFVILTSSEHFTKTETQSIDIFISQWKPMLLVLIRSTAMRSF